MATRKKASQKLEVEALQKKHEAEIARLHEKHTQENKPVMPGGKK